MESEVRGLTGVYQTTLQVENFIAKGFLLRKNMTRADKLGARTVSTPNLQQVGVHLVWQVQLDVHPVVKRNEFKSNCRSQIGFCVLCTEQHIKSSWCLTLLMPHSITHTPSWFGGLFKLQNLSSPPLTCQCCCSCFASLPAVSSSCLLIIHQLYMQHICRVWWARRLESKL